MSLNIGIIGLGLRARYVLNALLKYNLGVSVSAVFDLRAPDELRKEVGVQQIRFKWLRTPKKWQQLVIK